MYVVLLLFVKIFFLYGLERVTEGRNYFVAMQNESDTVPADKMTDAVSNISELLRAGGIRLYPHQVLFPLHAK